MQSVEPWRRFLIAHTRVVRAIESDLRDAGEVSLGWYDVLLELNTAEEGHLRMQELADRVVLSRSRVSRIVDELARFGYVRRDPDPHDGRASLARLTTSGRDALRAAAPVYLEGIKRHFLRHLTEPETEAIVAGFGRVIDAHS